MAKNMNSIKIHNHTFVQGCHLAFLKLCALFECRRMQHIQCLCQKICKILRISNFESNYLKNFGRKLALYLSFFSYIWIWPFSTNLAFFTLLKLATLFCVVCGTVQIVIGRGLGINEEKTFSKILCVRICLQFFFSKKQFLKRCLPKQLQNNRKEEDQT